MEERRKRAGGLVRHLTGSTKLALLALGLFACNSGGDNTDAHYSGWETYGGTKEGIRYSSLDQINPENVSQLRQAWSFSSYDKDSLDKSQIQCNPIIVNGVLYGVSPRSKLFAINANSGSPKWIFDPYDQDTSPGKDEMPRYQITRGVAYWESGDDRRILYGVGSVVYAINADNGKPDVAFGTRGSIDLAKGLNREGGFNPFVVNTTPGSVYKDLIIVGTRVAETADAAPGDIRAYDIRTGNLKWTFHTIPHPGEYGYNTWPDKNAWKKLGGANCWAGMSVDEKRGIVYVPTGSVAGDFYGGIRKGANLFANSLIALDAATGKYLWHFQTVHHDLWDRDLPANPNLVTVTHEGKKIDAVAQITKHGYIFLFDRLNGTPLFQIDEKPFPTDALPGEAPWPTQPIPSLPEPFARQSFNRDDVYGVTPQSHLELLKRFDQVKDNGMFMPPSKGGGFIFPGFDGGGEWGGAAFDPASSVMYIFSSEMPFSLHMIDAPKKHTNDAGENIYMRYCVTCHGADLKGAGPSFPSLIGVASRYSKDAITGIVSNGRNMMPAFKQLTNSEIQSLLLFISNKQNKEAAPPVASAAAGVSKGAAVAGILDEIPYVMTGYNRFLDKDGYPGITPPWGTLNAVSLNTGKLLWKVPVGEYPELTKKGIPVTGTEGYGGPLVTKGGLVFIAASKDAKIRAFDKTTGKQVWQADLPAPGFATPATYSIDGKQYVVIACGGGKIGSKSGDEYVAFALPDHLSSGAK